MKTTAQILGLLLTALCVTARADDTPVVPPAATPPADATAPAKEIVPAADLSAEAPAKAEAVAVTPPAAEVPFTPLANGKVDDKPADPNVLELPKMTVKQKPRPRLAPEIMVTRQAFGEELAKKKFSGLDQALNKFTIPLFGSSLAERALEENEREKKAQLAADTAVIAKAVEQIDPAEAKALKEAATKP
jgi:hypothetical protein